MVEKLPIPRIDQAVRWVAVKISAVLGDSYMLAHCPVQFAAMRTQVARDLRWLQERCEKVAVVAHSQGAAIAHQVLKDGGDRPGNLQAFITFGQGISKFHLLQRMDWDPQAYRAAWWSRVLVTAGLAFAGLPGLGLLAAHWVNATVVKALISMPLSALLIRAGFVIIAFGVFMRPCTPSAAARAGPGPAGRRILVERLLRKRRSGLERPARHRIRPSTRARPSR